MLGSYLLRELEESFVLSSTSNYYKGRTLGFDITVFLSPQMFSYGYGISGSYVGEAYVIGGVVGVIIISLLFGAGLHMLYGLSKSAVSLFVVATILPDVVMKPRGGLLDWASTLARCVISIVIFWFGWKIYSLLMSIRRTPAPRDFSNSVTTHG